MNSIELEQKMAPALNALGLFCFGWFVMPDDPFAGRKAVLIGNRAEGGEHHMWKVFRQSPEFADGKSHALDRWTEREIGVLAREMNAVAIFPFGDTLWPFQRYAKAATQMQSSPLGLLIHPEYGLWQAFRAVLVFDEKVALEVRTGIDIPTGKAKAHPCDSCVEKPCLSACPVNAFTSSGFDVSACRLHVINENEPDCMALGCRARAACPIGVPYEEEQIRFHMKAFAPI